jgi:hypothetical protein
MAQKAEPSPNKNTNPFGKQTNPPPKILPSNWASSHLDLDTVGERECCNRQSVEIYLPIYLHWTGPPLGTIIGWIIRHGWIGWPQCLVGPHRHCGGGTDQPQSQDNNVPFHSPLAKAATNPGGRLNAPVTPETPWADMEITWQTTCQVS